MILENININFLNKKELNQVRVTRFTKLPYINKKKTNQGTCGYQRPTIQELAWVACSSVLVDNGSTVKGKLALGKNLMVAYLPCEGYNFEDAVLISNALVLKDFFTSLHVEHYIIELEEDNIGREFLTKDIPSISIIEIDHLRNLDSNGIVKKGVWVKEGDYLVGKVKPILSKTLNSQYKSTILLEEIRSSNDNESFNDNESSNNEISIKNDPYFKKFFKEEFMIDDIKEIDESLFNIEELYILTDFLFLFKEETGEMYIIGDDNMKYYFIVEHKIDEFPNNDSNNSDESKDYNSDEFEDYNSDEPEDYNSDEFEDYNSDESEDYNSDEPEDSNKDESSGSNKDESSDSNKDESSGSNKDNDFFDDDSYLNEKNYSNEDDYFYNDGDFFDDDTYRDDEPGDNFPNNSNFFFPNSDIYYAYEEKYNDKNINSEKLSTLKKSINKQEYIDTSFRTPKGIEGLIVDVDILFSTQENLNMFQDDTISILGVKLTLLQRKQIQIGDKVSGRHGNKGIISKILPIEDMPYLPDGTPIDVVLNPLGIPSRMNVGQVLECLLGLAGKYLHESYNVNLFDEKFGKDASRSFVYAKLYEASIKAKKSWLFELEHPGKMKLFDGRTGLAFQQPVTVGYTYMLKLIHMVEEKIHARATGPYSTVTQQPVRGRAQNGGQRVGEMEVWAFQAYGAAYTLQELLTIKSDDLIGRNQATFNIVYNKPIEKIQPESLKLILREIQSLCFNIEIYVPSYKKEIDKISLIDLNDLDDILI